MRSLSANFLPPAVGTARILWWAALVNAVGSGMFLTSSAVFFVRYVRLPEQDVGLGLSVAGLAGLAAAIPVGRLADRREGKAVYVGTLLSEAISMAAFVLARDFWEFVAAASAAGMSASASVAASGALVRRSIADDATRFRARSRAVTNMGLAVGGLASGLVLAFGDAQTYPLQVLGNAGSFALCALIVCRLPATPAAPAGDSVGRAAALRDRPFLAIVGIYTVMMLHDPILTLVLPLWIIGHSAVPRAFVAALLPINTLMVMTLQVRMSRGIHSPMSAARLMPRAGLLLLAGLLLMAVVRGLPTLAATTALLAALVVFTLGEIVFATVAIELCYGLPPAEAQGQYLGLFATGGGLARAAGPAAACGLCLHHGAAGWFAFGILLLAAALATPGVTRRAVTRPAPTANRALPLRPERA